ncbi:MAG: prepilin peptidase [Candidatus Poribacteria bacterium]|nr:prepilin peptidase [Candidatus Poribacteria bacterium]
MDEIWIQVFIFIFGLAIGSFLNVCIYRIPRSDMSISSPRRSFCPACNQTIKFYDNIPLLSYLLLRGKCRNCSAKISSLYPIVELVTAVLFLVVFYRLEKTFDLNLIYALIFVTLLIPIAVIDAQHYIIPNVISLTGLVLGLGIVSAIAYQRGSIDYLRTGLIGFVVGGLVIWLVVFIGSAVMRKKAMGMGDVKLMAIIGLFLGVWQEPTWWQSIIMVIALSAFSGAVIGTLLIVTGRKSRQSPIPYGPFLAGAAIVVMLWGYPLWEKYLQLAGWN